MTDLDQVLAMLTRAGIEFERRDRRRPPNPELGWGVLWHTVVTVNNGYFGFYTDMAFTAEGALLEMGAYE